MRIILLTPTLDRSGAEKQLTLLACGLKRTTNWDIEVVALTRGGPYQQNLEEAQIPVTVIGKRFRCDPFALLRLKKLLQNRRPDVLHTWMFSANAYGRLAAGSKPNYRVIVSERCVDSWKSGWQLNLDRYLRQRTDRLLANSEAVSEFYRDVGYQNSVIEVIPNGVKIPPPRQSEIRTELRSAWQIPEDATVVAHIGRLAPQKRIGDLLWAFQLFHQLVDSSYFILAGDGPEREKLEELSISYTCDHKIRFLGHQPNGESLMDGIDLLWSGSDFEGQSNSIMEAMAAGVPVIASDIPPNRELVLPGQTGELFPLGNRTAVAQLSDRVVSDPEKYRRMSRASVERMRTKFSVERMVERHRIMYEQLLSEKCSLES